MGCDPFAFAVVDGHWLLPKDSPDLCKQFEAASVEVRDLAGCVDSDLETGALELSSSEYFLARALGFETIPRGDLWSPEEVQAMANRARWERPEEIAADDRRAYWSARRFFELCVLNNLGIFLS